MTETCTETCTETWLVFGGPYSNLRALAAMRAEAERRGIPASHTICTGDVVAYCAEPEETVRLIRDWGCRVVAGNCETQLASDASDCGCGFADGTLCQKLSDDWFTYARARISSDSRAWMADQPDDLTLAIGGLRVRFIHGGFVANNRFIFASGDAAIDDELARANADLVVAGHCGVPFFAERPGGFWFNPGVIGMPANDGTAATWYGLITLAPNHLTLTTHQLSYDHASAAQAMRHAQLADAYASALGSGLWPSMDVLPPTERAQRGQALQPLTHHIPRRS